LKPLAHSYRLSLLALLAAAFLLAGCGISLAEDITPPPNYRAPAQGAATGGDANVSLPAGPGDLRAGEAIYAEKCAPCHGASGLGDGPDSASLPNPAAKLGDPTLARQARPADWYQIVTVGNFQKFMPGFQSLDDNARWNVVGYALALSVTPAEMEQGRALFSENCAGCHGPGGRGDGPDAAGLAAPPGDWTDPARLANLSLVDMAEIIARGGQEMPAFGDRLDETQRLSLAAYVRSLSFAAGGPDEQAAVPAAGGETSQAGLTPEPEATTTAETPAQAAATTPANQKITVTGKVFSASPESQLPEDIRVSLVGYNGMTPAFTLEGEVDADGSYRFEDVEFRPEYVYLVSASANGLEFNSDIVHGSDIATSVIDLPVEIYATTTDPSALKADRLHVFFDFSTPGSIQVIELFIISNPSDRVVVAAAEGGAVLNFELPAGATNLQFEDSQLGERYLATEKGFGDRASVPPGMGQHQVLFAYQLPYDRKLDLDLRSPVPVDAAVVMLPQDGVKLKSDQLVDAGSRDVQGTTFRMYNAVGAVQPGASIRLELTGNPSGGTAGEDVGLTPLFIGGAVFVLALGGVAYWFIRQRRAWQPVYEAVGEDGEAAAETETSDSLLEAIVALDDLYQAGKLPENAYQKRRAELKARLAEVLEEEKGD